MAPETVRTHDALGYRLDDPDEQTMKERPYLLPIAFGFSIVSAIVSLPFSIPIGGIAGVNEHDVMAPSERFACWVLGRKHS